MKVQVTVKSANKVATISTETLNIVVKPTETALEFVERVASLTNTLAFPDTQLMFKGKALDGSQNLGSYGVVEGDALELIYEAREQTLVKQLSDLLGERAVSAEELGLLYIHRHGTSIDEVFKQLGLINQKISTFLEGQKCFSFENGFVKSSLVPENQAEEVTTNDAGIIEVRVSVQLNASKPSLCSFDDDDHTDETPLRLERIGTVANARKVIAAAELIPFPEHDLVLGDKKLANELSLDEAGVRSGDSLVLVVRASEKTLVSQLEELLRERAALSATELSLLYCQRFGTPVCQALRMLGLHSSIKRFLERHETFLITGGCVTLRDGNVLDIAVKALAETSFLNISSVEKGGCGPCGESVATIFVKGLPSSEESPVLESLRNAVVKSLVVAGDVNSASVVDDFIRVQIQGKIACLHLVAADSC
mmetsp:Transcript_61769/g.95886  ORF Transcript_61769/g.95886 Transcript_61769/m.95886 type:complete len:424 (-) Transcript_61769:19-1290(-)